MKHTLTTVSLLASTFLAPTALAGEFFIGINAGKSNFSELDNACDNLINARSSGPQFPVGCRVNEDSDTVLSVNAGYNVNQYVGAEVGYMEVGEYTSSVSISRISLSATAELDLAYAGLVFTLPVNDRLSLSARAGAVQAELDSSVIEIDDETAGFVGASFDFRLTDKVSMQVRYDEFDVIDVTTAGIRYHF